MIRYFGVDEMARKTKFKIKGLLAGVLASLLTTPLLAAGATLTPLHSFGGSDGNRASAPLIIGADGNFYGTTAAGGNSGSGSVFAMSSTDHSVTTLYNFSAGNSGNDGGSPQAALVLASDGNLYGTTRGGGSAASNNAGTIFQINTANRNLFTTIHRFSGTDGSHPVGGLVQSGNLLLGTTSDGGGNNLGTVYSLSLTQVGQITTMHNFAGGTEGAYPMAGVIVGADGNLYGTTFAGGTNNCGTIFKLTSAGAASVLTTLHSFTCSNASGQDLGFPMGGLVQTVDGTLYGTTTALGLRGTGTLFSIKPDGSGFTTLYTFTGGSDGLSPQATLTLGTDGNLYGTTPAVGQDNNSNGASNGTVFSFNPGSKTLTTLWGFSASTGGGTNNEGFNTVAGLIQGTDGNFYGVAASGGANSDGTIYQLIPATSLASPLTLTASSNTVLLSDTITLSWSLANSINTGGAVSQCFASGTDSNWTGTKSPSGSLQLTMNKLGTFSYALTCGGNLSATASVTVSSVPAPTGLTAVAGDGQVTLSWTAVTGAATYNVYEGINGVPSSTPIQTGITATSVTIPNLVDGTTYYFKVSAVSAAGSEGPKSSAVIAVPTAVATQPTGLVAIAKNGAVLLTWTAASGANAYNVYQSTTSGGEGTTPIASGVAANSSAPSYSVNGLTNGTTYYFQVASVNRTQTSTLSTEVSATPIPPPDVPTGISASAGNGTATISWSAANGATSYDVYETPASGSTVKIGSATAPTTSLTVAGLTNGTIYAFNVVAVNSAGSSAPSATVTVTPQSPPSGSGGTMAPEMLVLMTLAGLYRRRRSSQA